MHRSPRSRTVASLAIVALAAAVSSCSLWPHEDCGGDGCSGPERILEATVSQSGKLPDPALPLTVTDPSSLDELQAVLVEHGVWQQDVELLGGCTDMTITTIAYSTHAGSFELVTDGCLESDLADDALDVVVSWLASAPAGEATYALSEGLLGAGTHGQSLQATSEQLRELGELLATIGDIDPGDDVECVWSSVGTIDGVDAHGDAIAIVVDSCGASDDEQAVLDLLLSWSGAGDPGPPVEAVATATLTTDAGSTTLSGEELADLDALLAQHGIHGQDVDVAAEGDTETTIAYETASGSWIITVGEGDDDLTHDVLLLADAWMT